MHCALEDFFTSSKATRFGVFSYLEVDELSNLNAAKSQGKSRDLVLAEAFKLSSLVLPLISIHRLLFMV